MKKLKIKLLPLLSTSFCMIFNNNNQYLVPTNYKLKEVLVNTKLRTNTKEKTFKEVEVQNFINVLNETEVYLLTTKNNLLLLLYPETRINKEQTLINDRHTKLLFSSLQKKQQVKKNPNSSFPLFLSSSTVQIIKVPGIVEILKVLQSNVFLKTLGSGKSYYNESSKSICPIFFNKKSAEEFFIKNSFELNNLFQKDYPLLANQQVSKGFQNSKIISIGLGDLIYYSSLTKNHKLMNVEFTFFPFSNENISETNKLDKTNWETFNKKSFKFFQKKYELLKKI